MKKWKKTQFAYLAFIRFVGFSHDKTSRNLFRLFQIALFFVISIFMINILSIKLDKAPSFGTFGDFFGGVLNPILTFLMFMGVLITIVLQQKELRLTRQELKNSSKSLSAQAITQEKQRFENTFFSLLSQHNIALDKITEIKVSYAENDGIAKELLPLAQDAANKIFRVTARDKRSDITPIEAKLILLNHSDSVNQYFRILFQLLKLIAVSCPDSTMLNNFSIDSFKNTSCTKAEKSYSNIVRAILTEDIYFLLAVTCYCVNEGDKFIKYKYLIERYAFFEHMPLWVQNNEIQDMFRRIGLMNNLINSYDRSVFGDRASISP